MIKKIIEWFLKSYRERRCKIEEETILEDLLKKEKDPKKRKKIKKQLVELDQDLWRP